MYPCCCCLQRAPVMDLTTPYTYLGKTEIYSDMLKQCFNLHLQLGVSGAGECGICAACVGRLRDASDFKLQVQRSQAELQARLQGALRIKEEKPEVELKLEFGDGTTKEPVSDEEHPVKQEFVEQPEIDNELLHAAAPVKFEMPDEDEADELLLEERAAKPAVSDDAASDGDSVSPHRPAVAGDTRGHTAQAHSHTAACSCAMCAAHPSNSHSAKHKSARKSEKTYCCDICSGQFTGKSSLIRHIRTHMDQKHYVCAVNNKRSKVKSSLTLHQRNHTSEKLYTCDICHKGITTLSNLVKHKRTHTGNKPYTCVECNKRFTRRHSLLRHARSHTGEKPYSCLFCNKQFTNNFSLVAHNRMHTSENHSAVPIVTRDLHINGL